MDGACGTYGRKKRRILDFGGETSRKEPTLKPRGRCEDNIKMDLQEVGWWGEGGLIDPAQNRDRWRTLVKAVRNLRVP
jgi:hypothetical protein